MAETIDTVVIFAHPALERARIGPALAEAAAALPGVEVRDLYELYPDFTIDVDAEQQALNRCSRIVLQFPFYWYSAPALLKEWLDLVFTHGFAYGDAGKALAGKTLTCAISTGAGPFAFHERGEHGFSVEELLRPFEQTARLCGMRWTEPFVVYGAALLEEADLKRAADRYGRRLAQAG